MGTHPDQALPARCSCQGADEPPRPDPTPRQDHWAGGHALTLFPWQERRGKKGTACRSGGERPTLTLAQGPTKPHPPLGTALLPRPGVGQYPNTLTQFHCWVTIFSEDTQFYNDSVPLSNAKHLQSVSHTKKIHLGSRYICMELHGMIQEKGPIHRVMHWSFLLGNSTNTF